MIQRIDPPGAILSRLLQGLQSPVSNRVPPGLLNLLPFEEGDGWVAGKLRADLEAVGRPIGAYDILIAAPALRLGLTLITANVREFSRMKGFKWQDWASHEAARNVSVSAASRFTFNNLTPYNPSSNR